MAKSLHDLIKKIGDVVRERKGEPRYREGTHIISVQAAESCQYISLL